MNEKLVLPDVMFRPFSSLRRTIIFTVSKRGGDDMEHIIYADVLVFLNTAVTFMILLAVKDMVRTKTSAGRLIAGAFTGGVYSLIILAPPMNIFYILLTRIVMGLTIILIAFRENQPRRIIRILLIFFAATFALAGITYCASGIIPGMVTANNGAGYVDISSGTLILVTAVCYFCVYFLRKKLFVTVQQDNIYPVKLLDGEKTVEIKALYDSGNSLCDIYTGRPVIIVSADKARLIAGDVLGKYYEDGFITASDGDKKLRLLPAGTIAGDKLLPAFSVSSAEIDCNGRNISVSSPTVAVSDMGFDSGRYSALINDAILN